MAKTALSGIRVLDFTRLLPGPYCSMLLGDLGADVIKVEQPGIGDYARTMRKNFLRGGNAYNFLILNRNKRGLSLDLKRPEAVEIAKKLAAKSDVLLEGFRPGVMDRLGLGYEALKKENPRLIYCGITGYGQDGPYVDRAGHDINYVGYAGLVEMGGEPGEPPSLPGVQVADLAGGSLFAALGVLAALQARERTGQGQFVDASMMDGAFAVNFTAMAEQLALPDFDIKRGRTQLTGSVPCYGVYECSDGKSLTLGPLEEKFWETFCHKAGKPEWIEKRYPKELEESYKVRKEVAALLKTKPRKHWLDLLENEETCVGPALTPKEALSDPHVKARKLTYETEHPTGGPITQIAFPVKLSATPATYTRPAPAIGEHTDEILGELGYSKDKIAELRKKGAVA